MTFYQKANKIGSKLIGTKNTLKYAFNLSPMYRRTTARIIDISDDIMSITIKLPISYKNRNYVGTIFGGSMFSAVDPIPMIQLIHALGDQFVVWDKSAAIYFKRPAKENLYADFVFAPEEIEEIKNKATEKHEFELTKKTKLTNKDRTIVSCEVVKTIYIADKQFYKEKRRKKKQQKEKV